MNTPHSLADALAQLITATPAEEAVRTAFRARLAEGALTRDENAQTHFCVYFAAHDPDRGQVFMGHHKKSGKWLFNGGHIDAVETPSAALEREIGEEWGLTIPAAQIGPPRLLTLTEIAPNAVRPCLRHYDIWYFVAVDQAAFAPDAALLAEEFHAARWLRLEEARALSTDPATHTALALLCEM